MKQRMISFVVVSLLCLFPLHANAITTGQWNLSRIPEAIQRAAEEAEPPEHTQHPEIPVSDSILQQIYAARAAQYEAAYRYWRRR